MKLPSAKHLFVILLGTAASIWVLNRFVLSKQGGVSGFGAPKA